MDKSISNVIKCVKRLIRSFLQRLSQHIQLGTNLRGALLAQK